MKKNQILKRGCLDCKFCQTKIMRRKVEVYYSIVGDYHPEGPSSDIMELDRKYGGALPPNKFSSFKCKLFICGKMKKIIKKYTISLVSEDKKVNSEIYSMNVNYPYEYIPENNIKFVEPVDNCYIIKKLKSKTVVGINSYIKLKRRKRNNLSSLYQIIASADYIIDKDIFVYHIKGEDDSECTFKRSDFDVIQDTKKIKFNIFTSDEQYLEMQE